MALVRNAAMSLFDLDLPVVQGPFGGGLSTVALAAAASNGGALGSFGAHSFAPDRIGALADELRAATSRRFALNLWVSDHDAGGLAPSREAFEAAWRRFEPLYRELGVDKPEFAERFHPDFAQQAEALLEARPPVFSFVFGVPDKRILAACRARGILTVGAATTIAEAQALEAAGVDALVATGMEAGGHRPSFLASAEESLHGTFALVQLIAARVRIPVIAAGGIADARGVQAALVLGAQAAQIGSAFLACRESGTSDAHRALLLDPEAAQRTALTRGFSGRLARGLRNRYTDEFFPAMGAHAPFPLQGWFVAQLRAAAQAAGRTDVVSLWSGQIAPNLRHRDAASLLQALREGLD